MVTGAAKYFWLAPRMVLAAPGRAGPELRRAGCGGDVRGAGAGVAGGQRVGAGGARRRCQRPARWVRGRAVSGAMSRRQMPSAGRSRAWARAARTTVVCATATRVCPAWASSQAPARSADRGEGFAAGWGEAGVGEPGFVVDLVQGVPGPVAVVDVGEFGGDGRGAAEGGRGLPGGSGRCGGPGAGPGEGGGQGFGGAAAAFVEVVVAAELGPALSGGERGGDQQQCGHTEVVTRSGRRAPWRVSRAAKASPRVVQSTTWVPREVMRKV